jgi:hypothetical protein
MEGSQEAADRGADRSYTFFKPSEAKRKTREATIIGHAFIERGTLEIETNSLRRADALRKRIEKACGKLVRHRIRDHSDPVQAVQRAMAGSESTPESARFEREYKERYYADWIDEEITALKGKTPREAMRTKPGRDKLDLLLKQMEQQEQQQEEASRYDFAKLRGMLGLEP